MTFGIKTLTMIGGIALATVYVISRSIATSTENHFSIITSLRIPHSILPFSIPCQVLVPGLRFLFFKSIRDFFYLWINQKNFFCTIFWILGLNQDNFLDLKKKE